MKYALMISGLPGTMEFCFPSLKRHILDVYHPDVFICSGEQKDRFVELYNPIRIETYTHEYIKTKFAERLIKYKHSQTQPEKDLAVNWKSLRCSDMIAEHEKIHGNYDVIISTRPDVKFLSVAPITKPEPNVLYAPRIDALRCVPQDREGLHFGGYSTHLCWGTSEVLHKLCQFFYVSDVIYDRTELWHAEIMTKQLCDMFGIRRERVDIDMMIIRGTLGNLLSTDLKPLALFPEFNEE